MREKLASIQRVKSLHPIENADRIEVCTLVGLGWSVIVEKDSLKPGDLVLFCEIESALPVADARFSFLTSSLKQFRDSHGTILDSCYRIRSRKFRNVISQGLVVPLTSFPELLNKKEGDDCTKDLNVRHYDELAELYAGLQRGADLVGDAESSYPCFFPKTDQERLQSRMDLFESHANTLFCAELKADGSSMSVFSVDSSIHKDRFGVCSRNVYLRSKPKTRFDQFKSCMLGKSFTFKHWCKKLVHGVGLLLGRHEVPFKKSRLVEMSEKLGLERLLGEVHAKTGRNLVYQGELVGPGINSNRDKYMEDHWLVFDIYDVDAHAYMLPAERRIFLKHHLPMLEQVTPYGFIEPFLKDSSLDDLLKFVDARTPRGNTAEGCVFKSMTDPYVHFKLINNKYLLQEPKGA